MPMQISIGLLCILSSRFYAITFEISSVVILKTQLRDKIICVWNLIYELTHCLLVQGTYASSLCEANNRSMTKNTHNKCGHEEFN